MPADRHLTPHSERAKGSSILLSLGVAIVVAACAAGATPGSQGTSTPSATAVASPSPSPEPTQPPFPLTVRDDEGSEVTLAAVPRRIVSLSPANTEIVWALGAGDRQAGGTDYDDFPAAAAELPDVASYTGVDVERIVALEADLVLAAGSGFNPPESIRRLRSLGIPVLVVDAAEVDAVRADIELIGRAIGEWPAALALSAALRERIEAISAAAARSGTTPRTFYELDATNGIFGPAKDSVWAQMIELAGGVPITTDDPNVYAISLERLVAADPEVIILGDAAYGVTPEIVAARPGWGGMSAVRDGAIYPVDDVIVTRPGPRIADGLLALARAIHPDIPADLGL